MFEIEAPVRLSSSKLWRMNVEFYESQGADAWARDIVPMRITSNPMIAAAYADVIAGYLRDVAQSGQAHPVTVVEIGAGSGHFSYLLAQALNEAVELIGKNAPVAPYRYFVTDVAEANVRAWRDNPKFGELLASGRINLGVLDTDKPHQGKSALSGRSLAEIIGSGPSVVIANYVFDSLVCDAFRVEDGQLYEMAVGMECDTKPDSLVASPQLFKRLRFTQKKTAISPDYYPEPEFNDILRKYTAGLRDASFLFPCGGLRFLKAMRVISTGGMLALIADKGRADMADYESRSSLGLLPTGAYSTMVNFDAIGRWAQTFGGQIKRSEVPHDRFSVYGVTLGDIGQRGETELAFRRAIANAGPNYLHWLVGSVLETRPEMSTRALLALLEISRFDPEALVRMSGSLLLALARAEPGERALLKRAIQRCLDHHYNSAPDHDPNFVAGKLFLEMGEPAQALACFSASKGPPSLVAFHMAMCRVELGEGDAALGDMRRSIEARTQELRRAG
jgi:hypothetical protein